MRRPIDRRAILTTLASLPAIGGAKEAVPAFSDRAPGNARVPARQDFLDVRNFGARGDGNGEETSAFQRALDELGSGGVLFVPRGEYPIRSISPRPNTTIVLSPGAVISVLPSGEGNQLVAFENKVLANEPLRTALAGNPWIEVASTAAFRPGYRIIVSGGTFKGSGVEEGPLEFNTVRSIESGQRMTLEKPLQYSYSSFGIPAANPRVHSLGSSAKSLRNIRITGGVLRPSPEFDSIYFNFANAEDIEIDHVHIDGIGGGVATGHNVSNLNFHDNVVRGRAQAEGHGFDIASVVESFVTNNVFNINEDGSRVGQFNHLVFEVTCRDNLVAGNNIGPVRDTGTGGIDFTYFSFGNRIVNNRIWGCVDDLRAERTTIGIRTFTNGIDPRHPGNQITGNKITDLMHAICDSHSSSVITANIVFNAYLSNRSIGINCGNGMNESPYMANSFTNVAAPVKLNNGIHGGFAILSGSSAPPDQAGAGSIFIARAAVGGTSIWKREIGPTGLYWRPENRLPSVRFQDIPTAPDGTLVYVTDGVPGTQPLKGGGTGCISIRQGGEWKGL